VIRSRQDVVDDWTPGGTAHDRYRAALARRRDRDDRFARARADWTAHVRRHHGDVFGAAGRDPERAFEDVLTCDFVLSRLQRAAAEAFDLTAKSTDPTADSDAFAVPWDDLHDAVAADLDVDWRTLVPTDRDALAATSATDLGGIYEAIVPRATRLLVGEYYTPRGLADLAIADLDPAPDERVLDPGCGAGVFLTAALAHQRDEAGGATGNLSRLLSGVAGVDINPVAVRSARLALLLELLPDAAGAGRVSVPVSLGDAVGLTDGSEPLADLTAAVVVGNPPWVTWDRLTEPVKERWREGPIDDLDLFPHRGADARLGFGNDDVSVAFAATALHRYLRPGGRAGFVLKRDLRSGPAGRSLRRLRVGDRPLALRRVHDFGGLSPFGGQVSSAAALYLFDDAGDGSRPDDSAAATAPPDGGDSFPAPLVDWRAREGVAPDFDSLAALRSTLDRSETSLVPVASDDPATAWVRADAERRALGPCAHTIRHGVKDDAKAVFTVDDETLARIEPDHVYPYLRSKHVVKYGLFGHDRHLVPLRRTGEGDPEALARESPRTYAYLDEHRERLEARGSSWFDDDPFYDLFGLGPYTWAEYKVVWCRLGFKPHFAVVSTVDDPELGEKPVVPGDHFMFVATDDEAEAHYLAALLNSAPYQRCLRETASQGKATLSATVVSRLFLPAWDGGDLQRDLAARSREAHAIVPEYVDRSKRAYNRLTIPELDAVQAEIDRLAEAFLARRNAPNENP
jgi:hypothetical protein